MSLPLTDFNGLGESTVTLLSGYFRLVIFQCRLVDEESGVLAGLY
jgi:hypothetical protein